MNIALIDDRIKDLIDAESFLKNYIAENFSEQADSVQLDIFFTRRNISSRFLAEKIFSADFRYFYETA